MTNKEELAIMNSLVHADIWNEDTGIRMESQFVDCIQGDGMAIVLAKAWCQKMALPGERATIYDGQGYLVNVMSAERHWF